MASAKVLQILLYGAASVVLVAWVDLIYRKMQNHLESVRGPKIVWTWIAFIRMTQLGPRKQG